MPAAHWILLFFSFSFSLHFCAIRSTLKCELNQCVPSNGSASFLEPTTCMYTMSQHHNKLTNVKFTLCMHIWFQFDWRKIVKFTFKQHIDSKTTKKINFFFFHLPICLKAKQDEKNKQTLRISLEQIFAQPDHYLFYVNRTVSVSMNSNSLFKKPDIWFIKHCSIQLNEHQQWFIHSQPKPTATIRTLNMITLNRW